MSFKIRKWQQKEPFKIMPKCKGIRVLLYFSKNVKHMSYVNIKLWYMKEMDTWRHHSDYNYSEPYLYVYKLEANLN